MPIVSTNLFNVYGKYMLILRTWRVQIYITFIMSTNLSYVHGEYKFILRTW